MTGMKLRSGRTKANVVSYGIQRKIEWKAKDNICGLYAMWEMMDEKQRGLLTVR